MRFEIHAPREPQERAAVRPHMIFSFDIKQLPDATQSPIAPGRYKMTVGELHEGRFDTEEQTDPYYDVTLLPHSALRRKRPGYSAKIPANQDVVLARNEAPPLLDIVELVHDAEGHGHKKGAYIAAALGGAAIAGGIVIHRLYPKQR